jgi:hypothetical protein
VSEVTDEEKALENIKMYRIFAQYYFTTRTNLTYVNLVATGGLLAIFAHALIDAKKPYLDVLKENFPLFIAGGLALILISAWATAICSCLSNTVQIYLQMSRDLEEEYLNANYEPYSMRWAVEYELLTHPQDVGGKVLQGITWNGLNASVSICALFLMGMVCVAVGHSISAIIFFALAIAETVGVSFLMFRTDDRPPTWANAQREKDGGRNYRLIRSKHPRDRNSI